MAIFGTFTEETAMADRTDTFYAAEGAIHGYGAQLMVGDGATPEAFEAVAGVTTITPGDASTADLIRTHLRSPGAHHEHAPGMRDHGAFSLEGIYLPDEESQNTAGGGSGAFANGGLAAMWVARTYHNFRIVLNDGSPATTTTFRGYVSAYQPGAIGIDDFQHLTVGIMPSEDYAQA